MTDYKLTQPIETEDGRTADAVYENNQGAWLADFDGQNVMPLLDENGDYIPAPNGWQEKATEIK